MKKAINVPICQNKALVIVDHVLAGNITVSNIDSAQFLVGFFPDVDIVSDFSVIFIVYYFLTSTLVDIYVYKLTYFIVNLLNCHSFHYSEYCYIITSLIVI